jgi:hypothetical protein
MIARSFRKPVRYCSFGSVGYWTVSSLEIILAVVPSVQFWAFVFDISIANREAVGSQNWLRRTKSRE